MSISTLVSLIALTYILPATAFAQKGDMGTTQLGTGMSPPARVGPRGGNLGTQPWNTAPIEAYKGLTICDSSPLISDAMWTWVKQNFANAVGYEITATGEIIIFGEGGVVLATFENSAAAELSCTAAGTASAGGMGIVGKCMAYLFVVDCFYEAGKGWGQLGTGYNPMPEENPLSVPRPQLPTASNPHSVSRTPRCLS